MQTASYSFGDDKELCSICEIKEFTTECDKCGDVLCGEEGCCMIFPHHKTSTYAICQRCTAQINAKLIVLIDLGKLTILKKKIETGDTYANNGSRSNSREIVQNRR